MMKISIDQTEFFRSSLAMKSSNESPAIYTLIYIYIENKINKMINIISVYREEQCSFISIYNHELVLKFFFFIFFIIFFFVVAYLVLPVRRAVADDLCGHFLFPFGELSYSFIYGVFAQKTNNGHWFRLAHPVTPWFFFFFFFF